MLFTETEEIIMSSFESRVVVPTAMEYIQILLFIGNNTQDFTQIN